MTQLKFVIEMLDQLQDIACNAPAVEECKLTKLPNAQVPEGFAIYRLDVIVRTADPHDR